MAGAPSQLELFDHKPDLTKLDGQDCPGIVSGGQALRLHQRRAQAAGLAISVSSGRTERPLDFRPPAASGKTYRRSLLHQVDAHRPVQSCPGAVAGADRQRAPRLCLARFLGHLWAGHGKSESAGLHRADLGRQVRRTAASSFGGRAFCPAFIRACNAVPMASRCCIWRIREGVSRALRRSDAGCDRRNQSADLRRVRQSRNRHPDRPV